MTGEEQSAESFFLNRQIKLVCSVKGICIWNLSLIFKQSFLSFEEH